MVAMIATHGNLMTKNEGRRMTAAPLMMRRDLRASDT
jgi:hypothetical protein